MKALKPSGNSRSLPSLIHLKSHKKPNTDNPKKKLPKQPSSLLSKPTTPQDYIIINDSIYSANTFTERNHYQNFLHQVKKLKQIQRKSFLIKQPNNNHNSLKKSANQNKKPKTWKKLSPQDFIQTMTLQQKKQIFLKLQQDIRTASHSHQIIPTNIHPQNIHSKPHPSSLSFQNQLTERNRIDSQRERLQKFTVLQQKLQNYKMQLMFKWEAQIDKLQEMCRKNKISSTQKQTKVAIIQKLKDHKLKILDCTKTLFEKILKQQQYEQQHIQSKTNKIQAILKSLHSFPSLENLDQHYSQKQPNIDHLKVKQHQKQTPDFSPHHQLNFDSSPLEIVQDNQHQAFLNDFKDATWERINNKSVEDLKSPLTFLNNSPERGRFAEFDEQAKAKQTNPAYPSNPLFMESQELVESEHVLPFNKPLFEDGTDKISLKLDLRLDQVVFGQDQYPQCEKQDMTQAKDNIKIQQTPKFEKEFQNQRTSASPNPANTPQVLKLNIDKKQQENSQNLSPKRQQTSSPPKVQKISMSKISLSLNQNHHPEDDLQCKEQPAQKTIINIPMILSRQKMQTLAFEQNRVFRQNLDNRIAFQMGCIELEPPSPSQPVPFHFTTLVDINTYIVGFYEFMMRNYMGSLVDNLNIPYGKSAIDKLYSLKTEGFVIEESFNEMNNILSESHFVEYQREIMFTMRKCTQHQTAHNRAVFEAFTKCINVYRPYFDLEGEVFPWIVSEKGITFYEITEDNIEEVFEKSKIKVLEYCTSLCGLHPPSELKNQQQTMLMSQKNEENLTKTIKTEILEQFQEWKIRFVNFECLVRMLTANIVYKEILMELIQQMMTIEQRKTEDC